jgi:hypothetical protein
MAEELLAAAALAALALSDEESEDSDSTGLVETEWSDGSILGSYSVNGGTVDIISQTAQPGSVDEGLLRLAADAPAGRRYPDENRPGLLMNQPSGRKYRPDEIQKVADQWIDAIPEQGPNDPPGPEPGPLPERPPLPGGPMNPGGGLSDPGSFAPLVMSSSQPDLVTGRTSITRPTTTNEGRGSLTGIGASFDTNPSRPGGPSTPGGRPTPPQEEEEEEEEEGEETNSRGETSDQFHARMSQMAEDRGATWFPTGPFTGYTAAGGGRPEDEGGRNPDPDPDTGYFDPLPPREDEEKETLPNLSSSIQVQIDAWRNGEESCFEDVMGSGWSYRSNGNVLEATDIDFGSTPSANIALVIKTGYQIRLLVAIDRYTWSPKLSETDYIDEDYLRSGDALVTAAMFQEDEYASIPMTGGDYIQIDIDGTSEAIGDFRISSLGTEVTRSRALNDDVYIAIDPGSTSFDENRERVKPVPQPPPQDDDDDDNGNGNGSSDRMSPLSVVLVLAALGAFIYFLVGRRKGGGE